MVGLLGYVVTTTVDSAVSLDRAPNLVNATAVPAAKFGTFVEAERTAAVVYLFQPSPANLQAYQAAVAATDKAKPAFTAAMTSEATTKTETADAAKIVHGIVTGMNQLPKLRAAVQARALNPIDALNFYSSGFGQQVKLFLTQTESVVTNDQQSQAIGLIATVQAREQLAQEHALLAGMLAGHRMTQKDHLAFTNMAATRQADMAYANYILTPAYLAKYNAKLAGSGTMQQDLAGIEQAVVAGTPVAKLPVNLAQWQHLAGTLLQDDYNGGVAVANAILEADHRISHAAWTKVAVTGGIGLIGLLLTITVTILVARSIIRRLGGLERNALQLAENQLPDVVGRLRRGENVDVNAEAPALRIGRDEIGRVGQAFNLVRQTAIRAAVEEARLRQGLNDVFRSLARRSQSLLHRQLSLLDQMERRATDPEALDDLFRLDHLTTRMRRHAEGLVILAGAPPGRGWSSPVRMVDVMRGAIAEVEDYARVSVATRSQAALAGSAVADVIHLLAELIENATTLSPPYTSVRVSGDTVANGFVIEVEDRGLGMSPARLAELNDRLANTARVQPVRQRAARPVRGQPAGQAARDPGHAEGLALRRHGRHRARTAAPGGDRGGVPHRAARRTRDDSAHRQRQPRGPVDLVDARHPGRAGRPGIRLRVHRARRHARARPGARGAHLRAAAPLPGERPGMAGTAGTRRARRVRARPRRDERLVRP